MTKVDKDVEVVVNYEYITRPKGMFRRTAKGHLSPTQIIGLAKAEVAFQLRNAGENEIEDLIVEVQIKEVNTGTPKTILGESIPGEYEGDEK